MLWQKQSSKNFVENFIDLYEMTYEFYMTNHSIVLWEIQLFYDI